MKKILTTLVILSVAGSAIAETTYTETVVNKWTAPVAQKEKQIKQKKEATIKAQKKQQEAVKKRQEEYKKAQEKRQKELETAKKVHQEKMEQKKKDFKNLMKY